MAETMSHVERVLWRIAELGARCSQQAAAEGRGPLWAELEQTIAGIEAEFEAARQAGDIAPSQVRSLEGRLKVARQERDREKARAAECYADAESARRERDRAIAKARKAMAVAAEAKAAAIEARSTAAECVARAAAAEAAADQAIASRDEAVNALADALTAGERAADARDKALAAREEAVGARDDAIRALEAAQTRIADLQAALDAARAEQAEAVDTLAARAEGAVVVLPGVAAPEAPVGPIPSGERVAWQPTWSEWSRPDADEPTAGTVDVADAAADIDLDGSTDEDEGGVCRYLNVAATIAQLLPEDLGPLLLSGATVVRREGRLFATIAVTTTPWSPPGSDTAQAERLADAGYKVEWAAKAPLGV